jgi:hypothetical protein
MIETEVIAFDDLQKSFKRIRETKEGFITNLFHNPYVSSIWIRNKLLTKISTDKTDFFLRNDKSFFHLYFCSASNLSLKSDIAELMKFTNDRVFIVDILGNSIGIRTIGDLFLENGFNHYTSLVRMTRRQLESTKSQYKFSDEVEKAQDADLEQINDLLHEYFNCYSDQIPHVDELKDWITKGRIFICKSKNEIQGFIIFEDIGLTSYLRYWFVRPAFRERRVGSKLINAFFFETQSSLRHLFWVNDTNGNAIKRYQHYGFLTEDFIDMILINRQIEYEN